MQPVEPLGQRFVGRGVTVSAAEYASVVISYVPIGEAAAPDATFPRFGLDQGDLPRVRPGRHRRTDG